MAAYTFPNQRMVVIHREGLGSNFLGIRKENLTAAARDLSAHAFKLYIYLAANADNYKLALSPAAVEQAIGMARSTYQDQFRVLQNKGYIKPTRGNTYDFFEVAQPSTGTNSKNEVASAGQDFENQPSPGSSLPTNAQTKPPEDIEIDNKEISPNRVINKEDKKEEFPFHIPEVKEIVIKRPTATVKEPHPLRRKAKEFIF